MPSINKTDTGSVRADGEQSPTLGFARAVDIVCKAANSDQHNLSRTLSELGVDGISFQGTVFNGIARAGYTIAIDSIPDAPSSTLLSVAAVIENATLA